MQVSRRDLFKYAALGSAAAGIAALGSKSAVAHADGLGTLVDYSAGVPTAQGILDDGHVGAIRYVSDRRPGAEWMAGKPLKANEADALTSAGLAVVSCYQFGKGETADWRGGREAGKRHAERGLALHKAAGGPDNAPIYASIDDNPSITEIATMVGPYLLGWHDVVGRANTGVYANSGTITAAIAAGLGSFYWQHDWGTPKGFVHPAAHLHQLAGVASTIDGITVDVNDILKPAYGQW